LGPSRSKGYVRNGFVEGGYLLNLLLADPRFTNVQTDPRFRLPSKKNTHVQIDKRFARMLRDDDFSSRAKVDRYGRKLSKDAGREELRRYYRIAEDDEESVESEPDEDVKVGRELGRLNAEDNEASSSDDSSSDDEDLDDAEEEEVFGLLKDHEGEDGIPTGEVSSRIAVVNLDWDNIKAPDLMAVFSSFVPTGGRIRKVSIYPSQFGKERIQREEVNGPPREIFNSGKQNGRQTDSLRDSGKHNEEEKEEEGEDDEEDEGGRDEAEDERIKSSILKEDQGQEFNSAKLRRYQLERLRYFYAVLGCSSVSVAQAIYDAVDGTEYLTTANFFDLRYIPDEVGFTEDEPRDECTRIPDGYRPNEFVTDALQHSKVRLTWDADDGSRKEAQKRAFSGSRADIDENDLKAYLGSDSSDQEGPEPVVVDATEDTPRQAPENAEGKVGEAGPKLSRKEAERQKMRALLGLRSEPESKKGNEKAAPVGDLQVTFSSGLSSDPKKSSVFENEPERDETTAEKYVRKEKDRKARRKEKTKSSRNGTAPVENSTEGKGEPKERSAKDDETVQDLGFSDPFFTAPSHDKANTTAQRKADKLKRREERAAEEAAAAAKRAELELLMVDDKTNANDMSHFDMNDIAKAEKFLSKKRKSKKKLSEREAQALEAKESDRFKIDVGDERFRDVFESNEFAIDPSHPRFKGTEGMKRLLEEGRKKRKVSHGIGDGDEEIPREGKRRRADVEGEDRDLEKLVDRVKGKTSKQGRTKGT